MMRFAKSLVRRSGGAPVTTYIPALDTISDAKRRGLSVEAYVEELWGQSGQTAALVERIRQTGALEPTDTVVEIGPGTGRYLARVRDLAKPHRHVIFETAVDWRDWLVDEYRAEAPASNGELLTGVTTAGLIHAHGVFVYTPFLVTASYLAEMERVGIGWAVFDFYAESEFDDRAIADWLASEHRYPVVLNRLWVLSRLPSFELVDEWTSPYGLGNSRYLVLRHRDA